MRLWHVNTSGTIPCVCWRWLAGQGGSAHGVRRSARSHRAPRAGLARRRFVRRAVGALLLVMVVVVVAGTLALGFVAEQGTGLAITSNVINQAEARHAAESGVDCVLGYIEHQDDWRGAFEHAKEISDVAHGSTTFDLVVEDGIDTDGNGTIDGPSEGDGDLSDAADDPITLTVRGHAGGVTFTSKVVVNPELQQSKNLLFVVDDASSLIWQDEDRKTLFESWGYSVSLISSTDSQADFNDAFLTSDVIYVSSSAGGQLGNRVTNATIGVVNEENGVYSNLGVSSNSGSFSGDAIDIVDNSHYITSKFSLGVLKISTSSQSMRQLLGGIAPDIQTLAERVPSSDKCLTVVEQGGSLYDGTEAAGRRVMLPWGLSTFEVTALTSDGRTMLQRAVEWAAQQESETPYAHWAFDDASGLTAANSGSSGGDGTLTNGPTWTTGYRDGALSFDGSNDYVEVGGLGNLTGSFTITAWINPLSIAGDQRIFVDDKSNSQGFALSLGDGGSGRLRFFCRGINPIILDASVASITIGQWHFVAAVHDVAAKKRYIYSNGVLVGSDATPYSSTWGTDSGPAAIGGEVDGAGEGNHKYRFQGKIDDVRVYDRPLTFEELEAIRLGNEGTSSLQYRVDWLSGG